MEALPTDEEMLNTSCHKDSAKCLHLMKKLYYLFCDFGGRLTNCEVEDQELQEIISGINPPLIHATPRKRKG